MEPVNAANAANSGIIQQPLKDKKKTEKKGRVSFADKFRSAEAEAVQGAEPGLDEPVDSSLEELLDDVHSLGDILKKNPVMNNVMAYKDAVKQFIKYVLQNSYEIRKEKLTKFQVLKRRGQPELALVKIIDTKLDTLAAGILRNQFEQLEVLARVDEINGLLVDLIG